MLKEWRKRLRLAEEPERECPLRGCPVWQLYAQAAKERDELRKENEALRQKVTVRMAKKELEKEQPRDTYEELEELWGRV